MAPSLKCEVCGKLFNRKCNLVKHYKDIHQGFSFNIENKKPSLINVLCQDTLISFLYECETWRMDKRSVGLHRPDNGLRIKVWKGNWQLSTQPEARQKPWNMTAYVPPTIKDRELSY